MGFLSFKLVNNEVRNSFARCIREWFHESKSETPDIIKEFVNHLLTGKVEEVSYILKNEGYTQIFAYSICFYQKNCEIIMK